VCCAPCAALVAAALCILGRPPCLLTTPSPSTIEKRPPCCQHSTLAPDNAPYPPPSHVPPTPPPQNNQRAGKFVLLDGDKIATLAAVFLRRLLSQVPPSMLAPPPRIGVVQTAYANGASTDYITRTLGLETACTPTGVKHLHHVAKGFDVGIYFESNGHGTVLFKPAMVARLLDGLDEQVGG